MHPYATDSQERVKVIAVLVVISMVLGGVLSRVVPDMPDWLTWFIDFSSAALFGVLFTLTNRWFWRWPILRPLRMFALPDLNGSWEGTLQSSYDDYKKVHICRLVITQNWMNVCVLFSIAQSKSHSRAASILLDENGEIVLRYEYHNEPNEVERSILDPHWGTARLVLSNPLGTKNLEGTYYTNRRPQTSGQMKFDRVPT